MARYKHIDTSPRFLAVDLQRQLLPGTFTTIAGFVLSLGDDSARTRGEDIELAGGLKGGVRQEWKE